MVLTGLVGLPDYSEEEALAHREQPYKSIGRVDVPAMPKGVKNPVTISIKISPHTSIIRLQSGITDT